MNEEVSKSRHLRWGRRSWMWRRTMAEILDENVPDAQILLSLQKLVSSNEIRAQELSKGDSISKQGTLMHACAIAGRIKIAQQLIRYGADTECVNYLNQTPMQLALDHDQKLMTSFLNPKKTKASVSLEPEYAREEKELIWMQRKRRKNTVRQIDDGGLTLDERKGALLVLDQREKEEWFHLEGSFLSRGLAIQTIEDMKKRRAMF
jgi:ankyrin repeat protein